MIDDMGFTELAMGQQKPDHSLYAEFYFNAVQDPAATLEEGRPIFKEQAYVKIMVAGDKSTVVNRPVRLGQTPNHDNMKFAQQYTAFIAGAEQQLEGTPLREWPLISKSQVKELEHFNVKTVEMLAAMPDSAAQNFMAITRLREQARAYIESAKGDAPMVALQEEISLRDDKISAQQEQINSLIDDMKELQKPRRGRPPKED